jgi:hypothetical protein
MDLLNFIFRMGVLFTVYGFIWWIIDAFIGLLGIEKRKTIWEHYILLSIKYLFLANVSFLFCIDSETGFILNQHVIVGGLVLLMYFVGKMQRNQNQMLIFQFAGNAIPSKKAFNIRAEIITITLSSLAFLLMIFFPKTALNPIAEWFMNSIKILEKTAVIGFFFKVFGFFFLVSVVMKMMNAITLLLTGNLLVRMNSAIHHSSENKENDQFDDFEELK